jgi:DtxR family Mn-dependent transcriptional regulator
LKEENETELCEEMEIAANGEIAHGSQQPPLTPTMEDYMEALLNIGEEKRSIRVRDIAKRLGVTMPTVTGMLKTLSKRGLVDYEKYEHVELTEVGLKAGTEVRRKHDVLCRFLTSVLKIDFEQANEEACQMEHAITPSTLEKLLDFMEFLEICPRAGKSLLDFFEEYQMNGHNHERCLNRIMNFMNDLGETVRMMQDQNGKRE